MPLDIRTLLSEKMIMHVDVLYFTQVFHNSRFVCGGRGGEGGDKEVGLRRDPGNAALSPVACSKL